MEKRETTSYLTEPAIEAADTVTRRRRRRRRFQPMGAVSVKTTWF